MTYDDWKATDTTPAPERDGWCDKCEHYECDCPCCNEPDRSALLFLAARVAIADWADRDCCGKVDGKHWNKCGIGLLERAVAAWNK